jgi:hypothetical protein
MSNAIFHNKWHGFNHYTVPIEGFPDSATDPIASKEYPFKGIFYNSILGNFGNRFKEITVLFPGSGYKTTPTLSAITTTTSSIISSNPIFNVILNTKQTTVSAVQILYGGAFSGSISLVIIPSENDLITSTAFVSGIQEKISLDSDSYNWWFCYSLTYSNSADWCLYQTTFSTTTSLSDNWNLGYGGYTTLLANSAKYESVYTTSISLSPSYVYDFSGGKGWHIALSATTLKLNISGVNIAQKVATPVKIYENSDKTLTWNTSAQTVYVGITGNYTLTASDVIGAKKGGKYTFWAYIDNCPEEYSNLIFATSAYNISVKTLDGNYISNNEILALSANTVTRIDFVYDGDKMLGRATTYNSNLPTLDDLYFMGAGLRFSDPKNTNRKKNPVYISGIREEGESKKYFSSGDGISILSSSSTFTETSSIYIAGSGIRMRYLGANQNYFSYILYGASWLPVSILTKFPNLTASFDRVLGTLSGNGDWRDPIYAENLLASPDRDSIPLPEFNDAFPDPPYQFSTSTFRKVAKCLSSYALEIYSGADRDIDQIYINGVNTIIKPIVVNGMYQTYNFNNERTCSLYFERVQQDYDIEVYFNTQIPRRLPKNLLYYTSMCDNLIETDYNSNLMTWKSNSVDNYSLIQLNESYAPTLSTERALRSVVLQSDKYLTSNTPLTSLSSTNNNFMFSDFTTFTVFRTLNFSNTAVLWWLGEFSNDGSNKGYGLVLSGNRLAATSDFKNRLQSISNKTDSTILSANTLYVVCNRYGRVGNLQKQTIFVNNSPSIYQKYFYGLTSPAENFDLIFGKDPRGDFGYSNIKLYDFYLYKKQFTNGEIIRMNSFLLEKFKSYRDV